MSGNELLSRFEDQNTRMQAKLETLEVMVDAYLQATRERTYD